MQVRVGKHSSAQSRYMRVLKLMDSTRDFETQVSVQMMIDVCLSNLGQTCELSAEFWKNDVAKLGGEMHDGAGVRCACIQEGFHASQHLFCP